MTQAQDIADKFEGQTFQNNTDTDLKGDNLIRVERVRHPHDHEEEALHFAVCSVEDSVYEETFTQFEVQERMKDGRWELV